MQQRYDLIFLFHILRYVLTFAILWMIAVVASDGELLDHLNEYPIDKEFLLAYLGVGIILVNILCWIGKNNIGTVFLTFLYYFTACACFMDGRSDTSWSHTTSVLDKLFITGLNMFFLAYTVAVPVLLILLAFVHNLLLLKLSKAFELDDE